MNFTDVQNRVFFLTSTDSTSYTDANLTLAVGRAMERVVSLINRSDSRWQWDDSNQTDLPIAKAALVASQQDYGLATTHLTIDRVEIKDSSGQWHRLSPLDQQDIKRSGRSSYNTSGIIGGTNQGLALAVGESSRTGAYKATSGLPEEYDIIGSSVFLYPVPNYSQASSLFIYFTRQGKNFDYTDDKFDDDTGSLTSVPGFNPLFHDLIPLWASYDYAIVFKPNIVVALFNEIQRKEQELISFFGQRNRDDRPRFSTSTDSNK